MSSIENNLQLLITEFTEMATISEEVSKEDGNDDFLYGYAVGQKSAYEEAVFRLNLVLKEASTLSSGS